MNYKVPNQPDDETHSCDGCGSEFKCRGVMAQLPQYCLCTQEIGEVVEHNGAKKRRLLFYCGAHCCEIDMGQSSEEDDDEDMLNWNY